MRILSLRGDGIESLSFMMGMGKKLYSQSLHMNNSGYANLPFLKITFLFIRVFSIILKMLYFLRPTSQMIFINELLL
ncbi:hypothetical protein DMS23_07890 [Klebsiella variicola]|nr:hypothetical protein DMS23_07890 [Klebsiella variicola]